jgi:uncharacterized protein CbrC (UPF0167 family)
VSAEERYDAALQDLFALMRPDISTELAAEVVTRATTTGMEWALEMLEGGLDAC